MSVTRVTMNKTSRDKLKAVMFSDLVNGHVIKSPLGSADLPPIDLV